MKMIFLIPLFTGITISLIDVLWIFGINLGQLGFWLWLLGWASIAAFTTHVFCGFVRDTIQRKEILTLSVFLFIVLGLITYVSFNKNPWHETAIQTQCALVSIQLKDKGFWNTCMFGYPMRQYYVSALPTLIWGRNIKALNLGGFVYFILSLSLFTSGLYSYMKGHKYVDLICAVVLSSFLHFYYLTNSLLFSEQSIFPFYFALMVIGVLLHHLANNNWQYLGFIPLILIFLIYVYTPALAFVFLSLATISYLLYQKKDLLMKKKVLSIIMIVAIVTLITSFRIRDDVVLYKPSEKNIIQLAADLSETFRHLFLQPIGNHIIFLPLVSTFIFMIGMSLMLLLGKEFFLLSVWIVGVILFSVFSRGYSYYGVDFRLQRVTVAFPVLVTMLSIILSKIDMKKKYLFGIFVLTFVLGVGFQWNYLQKQSRNNYYHYQLLEMISKYVRKGKTDKIDSLYFIDDKTPEFISIYDITQYFYPRMHVQFLQEYGTQHSCDELYKLNGIVIIENNHPCLSSLNRASNNIMNLGNYLHMGYRRLNIYQTRNENRI